MTPVRLFQDFQKTFGFCPCCGELFRLSDAKLLHRAAPPSTPFDNLEAEWENLERARQLLEEQTERMREKAREAGRKERDRRLAVLASFFRRHRIALSDMKLLFHPVDYVTFHGLAEGSCTSVELLDHEAVSVDHERLQRSIQQTLRAGNFEWKTMIIAENGRVTCT